MNERIKELAEQAGIYKLNLSDETEYWIMEKFAQLIVRECAAEADRQTIYCRGIPWGRWIKEHFGLQG
jgi:hypothetical protein